MTDALGTTGMIGGQVVDIESESKQIDAKTLEYIHVCKTGRLIKACIRTGAILSQANETQLNFLSDYGGQIGLAFGDGFSLAATRMPHMNFPGV